MKKYLSIVAILLALMFSSCPPRNEVQEPESEPEIEVKPITLMDGSYKCGSFGYQPTLDEKTHETLDGPTFSMWWHVKGDSIKVEGDIAYGYFKDGSYTYKIDAKKGVINLQGSRINHEIPIELSYDKELIILKVVNEYFTNIRLIKKVKSE